MLQIRIVIWQWWQNTWSRHFVAGELWGTRELSVEAETATQPTSTAASPGRVHSQVDSALIQADPGQNWLAMSDWSHTGTTNDFHTAENAAIIIQHTSYQHNKSYTKWNSYNYYQHVPYATAVQQVMWLVVTEVQSESFGLVRQHHPYNAHPIYASLSYVAKVISFIIKCGVACFLCAMRIFEVWASSSSPGYLCAKFHFFRGRHCWASPWRKIAYPITHSLSHSLIWCPRNRSFHFRTTAYLWRPTNSVGGLKRKFWTYYRSFVHEMWSMTTTPSQYIDASCQWCLHEYCKFHPQPMPLTLSLLILLRLYTLPYWSNPPSFNFWHLDLGDVALRTEC